MMLPLKRIVSGGQTGADRAGLDWAIVMGIPHGGWCPKGRRAEDGPIHARYELVETSSRNYAVRTQLNIRDSDATVIFSCAKQISRGTALTQKLAVELKKPLLHIHAEHGISLAAAHLGSFIRGHRVKVLNIAGPRESTEPEVGYFVINVLNSTFSEGDGRK